MLRPISVESCLSGMNKYGITIQQAGFCTHQKLVNVFKDLPPAMNIPHMDTPNFEGKGDEIRGEVLKNTTER